MGVERCARFILLLNLSRHVLGGFLVSTRASGTTVEEFRVAPPASLKFPLVLLKLCGLAVFIFSCVYQESVSSSH